MYAKLKADESKVGDVVVLGDNKVVFKVENESISVTADEAKVYTNDGTLITDLKGYIASLPKWIPEKQTKTQY